MRYLIVSDIHGDKSSAEFILNKYKSGDFCKLICLGDVLYHGPRNDLPEFYNPKEVIKLLNSISNDIICIQGNCDAEVDQMVLSFDIVKSIDLNINGYNCHFEHGHHLDKYNGHHNIVFFGHTHIPLIEEENNQVFVNPGSISIPKNGSNRDYIIFDDNKITIYDINDNIVKEYILK